MKARWNLSLPQTSRANPLSHTHTPVNRSNRRNMYTHWHTLSLSLSLSPSNTVCIIALAFTSVPIPISVLKIISLSLSMSLSLPLSPSIFFIMCIFFFLYVLICAGKKNPCALSNVANFFLGKRIFWKLVNPFPRMFSPKQTPKTNETISLAGWFVVLKYHVSYLCF